ncbi:peptide-methionine (S)-S-oxide reductase MsrA [Pedobacter mucosus]|uniref:peptide-methionine (S)-S-oxide reductase MsrA n=1 Tax=Pedobacter mucosus TaxID=2895286 RepID=UPI001EE411F1|nr:peptide-methionine (S)-S-oxide reductase MsrA [Pedobacter mucosus]UKT62273.1 peptide-methionine (S)-S-oxide reductase MsrA [Pedobacter mucosus]
MRLFKICLFGLIFLSACQNNRIKTKESEFASLPKPAANEQVATFAGGCFWALAEGMSELKGVTKVVSGYAGGTTKNPTYEEVCADNTGHAESVQVYYDPKIISYSQLAEAFLYAHDPTTLNRQGPDEGEDYRSIAFYRSPQEEEILESTFAKVDASRHYPNPIVTEIKPYKVLYAAENYHQGYYKLHPNSSYIQFVSVPKVMKLRKTMSDFIKPEFKGNWPQTLN